MIWIRAGSHLRTGRVTVDMIKYIPFDLETTCNGGPDKNSPEAHWRDNKILLCGYSAGGRIMVSNKISDLLLYIDNTMRIGDTPCLVAHNAKFDIKYLMREAEQLRWDKVKVWDTMVWEYRHSGQRHKMWGLEKTASAYNIPFKKSLDLGKILKSGVKMEDIDTNLLELYLKEDVKVLEDIHKYQLQTGEEFNMDYILPLCEMELNGMVVDQEKAEELAQDLVKKISSIETNFMELIKDQCKWQDGSAIEDEDFTTEIGTKSKCIKPLANRTLSFLLTGKPEVLQVTPKWNVMFRQDASLPVYPNKVPDYYVDYSDNLGYSVSEDVLTQESDHIAREALEHRKANKLMSTYVGPMLHSARVQGTIHPKLNTAITYTGRLSSSNPNGQNMPPEARELIMGAEIVEIDFSQLELVAVACISNCQKLINDLRSGVDIHYNTASKVFGSDKAQEMRKIAKNVNFGVLYGGKAIGLSKQTGVDRSVVQKLIDAFYSKYPGVGIWQKKIFNQVVDNMTPYDIHNGEQRYQSVYVEPVSKRKFKFIEQESPKWLRQKTGRKHSFSPQQTSNYPIQGFAGGDIVMQALYELWKQADRRYVRFLMTVHDSIILEVCPTYKLLADDISTTLAKVENYFNLPLHLEYDVYYGEYWK